MIHIHISKLNPSTCFSKVDDIIEMKTSGSLQDKLPTRLHLKTASQPWHRLNFWQIAHEWSQRAGQPGLSPILPQIPLFRQGLPFQKGTQEPTFRYAKAHFQNCIVCKNQNN